MAELFERDGVPWIREKNGVEHEAGDLAQAEMPQEPAPDPVDILSAKVDLVLMARIKDGSLTADMVQASALPEATKTELTDQIAAEKVASTT